MVPLPPIFNMPKRRKGTEQVMRLGVILRITITFSGSEGMSLDDIFADATAVDSVIV